jgi:hypothetical protein
METESQVDELIKTLMQLKDMKSEFVELSKKRPTDAVNKFKLKLVNVLIDKANALIDASNRPFDDFNRFDEDDLPNNSDVVLILSQYVSCMKKYAREQMVYASPHYYWVIGGKQSRIEVADHNHFL